MKIIYIFLFLVSPLFSQWNPVVEADYWEIKANQVGFYVLDLSDYFHFTIEYEAKWVWTQYYGLEGSTNGGTPIPPDTLMRFFVLYDTMWNDISLYDSIEFNTDKNDSVAYMSSRRPLFSELGDYQAFIRVVDIDGLKSGWSNKIEFRLVSDSLDKPTNLEIRF